MGVATAREKPHKRLELWKEAVDLVLVIYGITKSFPKEEALGLKSHLRRAAVSIPSNISEGLTRKTKKDKHLLTFH